MGAIWTLCKIRTKLQARRESLLIVNTPIQGIGIKFPEDQLLLRERTIQKCCDLSVYQYCVLVLEVSPQYTLRNLILDVLLDDALHRSSTIVGIITKASQKLDSRIRHFELNFAIGNSLLHALQLA